MSLASYQAALPRTDRVADSPRRVKILVEKAIFEARRRVRKGCLRKRARVQAGEDLVFVSRRGGQLTRRHVQIMVRRYGRQAGIKGVRVSPHTLRHTFATQYIRNGGDPFSLQAIRGHSTLEMVRNYVNLASRDVAVQHRKFSPLDRLFQT